MIMIIIFNTVIDPFNIYHDKVFNGYNQLKPGALRQIRLIKAEMAIDIRPEIIFLGTSRAHEGQSCKHPAFSKRRCANLALHGSTMYENYRYYQHAAASGPVKTVILGIDFFSFNQNRDNRNHFSEELLTVSDSGVLQSPNYLFERVKLASSLDSLKYSRRTIRKSRQALNGKVVKLRSNKNIVYERWKQHCDGYLNDTWFPKNKPEFTMLPDSNVLSMLHKFRLTVRESYHDNVDLYLVISPSHAWLWETLDAARLWNDFELWKLQIVSIVEDEAARANAAPYPVWDFSGYNTISTDSAPSKHGPAVESKLYSDPSHYRTIVGDMVIDRILDTKFNGSAIPNDFGFRLTTKNIKGHLKRIRHNQKHYRKNNSDTYSMLEQLSGDAARKRNDGIMGKANEF